MTCPRCDSPAPHLHPAVQHGGEVQVCHDDFHRAVTPQNTVDRIRGVPLSHDDLTICKILVDAGMPKHDAVDIVEEFARISDAAIAKLVARFARLEPLLLAAITTLEARTDRDTRIEAARALRAALAGIAELETPPAREMPASTLDGDQ